MDVERSSLILCKPFQLSGCWVSCGQPPAFPGGCCSFSSDSCTSWGSSSLVPSLFSCPGLTVYPMFSTLVPFLLISRLVSLMGPSKILISHFYPYPTKPFLFSDSKWDSGAYTQVSSKMVTFTSTEEFHIGVKVLLKVLAYLFTADKDLLGGWKPIFLFEHPHCFNYSISYFLKKGLIQCQFVFSFSFQHQPIVYSYSNFSHNNVNFIFPLPCLKSFISESIHFPGVFSSWVFVLHAVSLFNFFFIFWVSHIIPPIPPIFSPPKNKAK